MQDMELDRVFAGLRRFPDVEAPNLFAHDASDRLLLETAAEHARAGMRVTVLGDRYGALTLGALAVLDPGGIRVSQDLHSGRSALQRNAAAAGLEARFESVPPGPGLFGPELFDGAGLVLLQLPRSLAELEEIADAVARHAPGDAVLLAGGRVKHMSLGMNAVLERYFDSVQPQLARRKSRVLVARGPKRPAAAPPFPVLEQVPELGITVASHGAAFSGGKLDIGTRFLLSFLDRMPDAAHAVDLGCGTGILAAMYARSHPAARVTATDQSAAAVASTEATAAANGLADRITVVHDDAMSGLEAGSADLILLNPPFHLGASVHAGAAFKMFEAASRVLAAGGELWTVYNSHLQYRPALERLIGSTTEIGRNPKFTVTRSVKA
ncbi:class I SAM-dependent methyltransferase [Arthrobacter cupressi]|uniref:16S rRNA (Guanine1207-N2)-methyltransferase n=1 Tax=Arthrobacter cupressi TaxID=1045773 RepID=A0A1G8WBQ7_9MICC|nr:class I SAM-dependent methyltransferase [Arthrobacter cupressi]NYD76351.1 16S rRNA (guanine1207-N2)-methyltransferase [Arthrobacter cupressi]SDJ75000.1 16S rRNA (guanine1207-N2)-methyltransferase [Arthrobacter cupressi]